MVKKELSGSDARSVALVRQEIIRPLAAQVRLRARDVENAGCALGLSKRQIYRLIEAYRISPYLDTLRSKATFQISITTRLPAEVEAVIEHCLVKYVLSQSETTTASALHKKVKSRCKRKGLTPPSLSTVKRRLKQLPKQALARAGQLKGSRVPRQGLWGQSW